MLPHEDLAPWYGKVVWLYVCRTWREDEPDREAARIHDRFGITSWPHLFLTHPEDDRVLQRAGRTVEALEGAFASAIAAVEPLAPEAAHEAVGRVRATRDRVLALESQAATPTRTEAGALLGLLEDPDVLVRHRALRLVLLADLPEWKDHAETLLVEGNDAIRFEVLDRIEKDGVPALTPLLVRVFQEAGRALPSGNPNVLRGRAARCLVACGDERAIDALAPVARAAEARSATTRSVVEALGGIGARGDAAAKARVVEVLLASWPAAVEPAANGSPTVVGRYALRLAEAVAQALGRVAGDGASGDPPPELPKGWSEAERAAYVAAVTDRLRGASGR